MNNGNPKVKNNIDYLFQFYALRHPPYSQSYQKLKNLFKEIPNTKVCL